MALLEGKEFGYVDLILLDEVSEEKVNENLKLRFEKGKVSRNSQCVVNFLVIFSNEYDKAP